MAPSLFFFNATATTEIYTLSLHDALPICPKRSAASCTDARSATSAPSTTCSPDRKSTRLNSSHGYISYAVFCLKKKRLVLLLAVLLLLLLVAPCLNCFEAVTTPPPVSSKV